MDTGLGDNEKRKKVYEQLQKDVSFFKKELFLGFEKLLCREQAERVVQGKKTIYN